MKEVIKCLNIVNLLVRRIFGENSEREEKKLDSWIKLNKHVSEDVYNWQGFKERQKKASAFQIEDNWKDLQLKIQDRDKKAKAYKWTRFFKYAAAASVLLAGIFYYMDYNRQEAKIVADVPIVKENPKGVKSRYLLPDGTKVWLNAASRISYNENFTDTSRMVSLKGEAYFEVIKDATRPFSVVTEEIVTVALGTSFDIDAYNTDQIKVSLVTGKVDVINAATNENVILSPGDRAIADDLGLTVDAFDSELVLAWQKGIIHFDNTEFDEMISVLENWYAVSFVVENLSAEKRKTLKATGKFEKQTLSNVLKLISHSMNFKYKIEGKVVTLKF